ncbi:putative exonuclease 1 [Phytophthora cinnamomi]|uniref:putative exonuclease 1 n=1 Tax=Phytophthora cinnamomi TaxID=4785 RepID=UPI0035595F02|nr:putative exonuclease 1 [Phytophthora cinnamomi]
MASWAALNVSAGDARASAAQARATEEAQDADNAALYEQALRCQQRRETARARQLYEQLLSGAVAVSARLEYLCHKNLASMEVEARAFEAALTCFARALALDATDVVVWCQMGQAAVETGKLWLARRALEEGLRVDATYWPLARALAEVLHELGDAHAYARVAAHIRAHDPLCASVRVLDEEPKFMGKMGKMGTNRDDKLLRRARKRLDHLHDIAEGQKKRRKVLQQRRSQQLEQSMQSRKYELTQPSWSALGKVLLEAFEDGNRDEEVDVLRAAVQIQVSYEQVEKESVEEKEEKEEEEEEGEKEETGDKEEVLDEEKHVEEDLPPPPAKRPKHKEVAKVSAALETSLSTGVSDNDTQDSGIQLSDLLEFPPRRRKSRRNEERLREEHAAAVKKAREKDLAYRLGAFLPDAVGDEERESTPESVSIEWLPPLDIKLVDAKFRVSNASKEIIAQIPPFAFPSSTEGSAIAMDSQSSQKSSRDRTASREAPSHAELVTGKRISEFPASVSPPLEAYLAPKGLLQEEIPPPFPLDAGTTATSADEACLGHLWYLMGANFILGRVKRRGNLGELMDMEQQVRERVEFLMKDVLYYHPDRIDSWIRLGKTMKELYHAATDAFAAVLGQKLRIQALRWYTAKIFVEDSSQQELSFDNVVLDWSLFKKMKGWESKGTDGHKPGKVSTSKDFKEETKKYTDQSQPATGRIPIEVFATTYIAQVIEFARRCFDMAARLAEEATKTHKMKLQSQSDSAGEDAEGEGDDFDEKLDELHSKSIECNEECGLLLYNVLQEFSLMKELNAALFPLTVYSRLLEKTLVYFREGLAICESNDDAHEDHFRLQYMIGKTLKKKRWCELRRQDLSDPDALSTATEMASCFAKAEAARDEGDREHALVHAFYSLQALRIDLTISESPSVAALRLVCNHFYEEEEEEKDDDEEGDDESADSDLTKATDEKSSSEENVASPASEVSATKASSKTTSDIKSASSTKKDEILALLSDTGSDDDIRELNVTLARGWLALNIIEALESIPDEDRYFHPSRYVLARLVYWLSTFYSVLGQSGYTDDTVSALLGAIQARRNEEKVEGPSDAAARALKEMAPIFDKRRPQIVAIWFSEYIPSAKKFEELNQRQMKYDYYRLKYWRFYIALLQENEAYARLKEVGSWVLACKEEHDVIDIMLGMVLHARGKVLRSRLQAFFNTIEGASTGKSGVDTLDMMTQTQLAGEDRPVDALLKQLAKTYSYYLEVSNAQQRLSHIMDDSSLLVENAELPMVTLFFVGAITYPSEMPLLEKDTVILDREFNANIIVIKNALRRDELPPRIYDAQGRETWKAYLDAARSFCEEKWPERSGKGKPSKKHSRPKAVTVAAPTTASSTDAGQPTANASS